MTIPAIRVERLGKRYTLAHHRDAHARYKTLRESVAGGVATVARRLRGERSAAARDFWALRDVSFEVRPGEVLGIVGRNGAGKSTLLKILSRITKPTTGRVVLNGRVGSLLEVGTGFHPELTGRENIYLNGSILGMSRREIDRKFDEIVAFSEIERFLDTPVKRYSSGMYVRLAFAVAAHLDPEILIVDEVLAVGDAAFQKKCLGKMGDITRGGRTVLFVSHNLSTLRTLCRSGLLLDGGRAEAFDDIGACLDRYAAAVGEQVRAAVDLPHSDAKPSQMTRIELLRADGAPTDTFEYGDRVLIRVTFRSDVPTASAALGLVVSTDRGDRVLNTNMHFLNGGAEYEPCRHGRILCDLGPVPLVEGNYTVSFWFGCRGVEHDVVPDAIGFRVVEKDIWGRGKLPGKSAALLWWPAEFTVTPADGSESECGGKP